MNDFTFVSPTKIYFGEKYIFDIGRILKEKDVKKVLIVYGNHPKKIGLIDKIIELLNLENIKTYELSEIRVNPKKEKVYEGISLFKKYKIDFILAIGGGSVIDTSKAIAAGSLVDFDFFNFNLHKDVVKKALPIGVILTIAASGSELSDSCVISDDLNNIKNGFNSDLVRPTLAFLNPNFLKTLPKIEMARGITDIFMHTFERYIYKSSNNEIADGFAISLLTNLINSTKKYLKDNNDYEALSNIMLLGSFSHNGLTSIGKPFIMIVHKLEHNVGGFYPLLVHADGLSILVRSFLNNYKLFIKDKLIKLGKEAFNLANLDEFNLMNFTVQEIINFLDSLKMPKKFSDLDISFDPVNMSDNLLKGSEVYKYSLHDLNKEDLIKIYKESL